jgi:hypothetical protein
MEYLHIRWQFGLRSLLVSPNLTLLYDHFIIGCHHMYEKIRRSRHTRMLRTPMEKEGDKDFYNPRKNPYETKSYSVFNSLYSYNLTKSQTLYKRSFINKESNNGVS